MLSLRLIKKVVSYKFDGMLSLDMIQPCELKASTVIIWFKWGLNSIYIYIFFLSPVFMELDNITG